MATVITHAVTALALGKICTNKSMGVRFWLASVLCACIPDADVIGFALGVQYGDHLGHRGFFHSISFAFLLALLVVCNEYKRIPALTYHLFYFFAYFFVLTASHGVLDGMTNGGLGIAFFSPLDTTRYFLPWRPLEVPPIGISAFFSEWGLRVMLSEIVWIWLPTALLVSVTVLFRRLTGKSGLLDPHK